MNRNIIYVLLALFRKITLNSNTTFMTAENLGIVWGPNFLRPKQDTSQTMMDMSLITKMVPILINSTDEIPLDESIHQLTEEEKKELKETAKVYVLPANDTKEKPHFENKQEDTHAFKQNSIYTMFESLLSKKKIILRVLLFFFFSIFLKLLNNRVKCCLNFLEFNKYFLKPRERFTNLNIWSCQIRIFTHST